MEVQGPHNTLHQSIKPLEIHGNHPHRLTSYMDFHHVFQRSSFQRGALVERTHNLVFEVL
jgi:hypothetical protein